MRLRQWRRVTADTDELTYKQIVVTLGWMDVQNDVTVVKALTDVLIRGLRKENINAWYVQRGNLRLWRWVHCLADVRFFLFPSMTSPAT